MEGGVINIVLLLVKLMIIIYLFIASSICLVTCGLHSWVELGGGGVGGVSGLSE